MQTYNFKAILKAALRVACILPFAAAAALGQQTVNLTAGPATTILPDGSTVPMWGYSCGAAVTAVTSTAATTYTLTNASDATLVMPINAYAGSTVTAGTSSGTVLSNTATTLTLTTAGWTGVTPTNGTVFSLAASKANCAALNKAAIAGMWSPVIITVPTGQNLTINLTNNLSFTFTPTGSTTPVTNTVPTSLGIVGQLGGGLGTTATKKDSPAHTIQGATWPIAGDSNGATFNPPSQGQRVQSFSTEVAFGATTSLTWTAPRPGTYLIESGTHPSIQGPMGLYGMLVVTCAPTDTTSGCTTGTAYPGVSYNAEVPLLLSEIDAAQNNAVSAAVTTVGFSETSARVLRDSVSSVSLALDPLTGNIISAGTGYHVGDAIVFSGGGFSVVATAHVSSVDTTVGPTNGAITAIVVDDPGKGYSSVPLVTVTRTSGTGTNAQIVAALSLAGVMCSDSAAACYPPAVNYTPLYYLFNGVAFNRTSALASLFGATPGTVATPVSGNVLVRLVNAGLRMHVPSIVGSQTAGAAAVSGFSLIAEDGNPLPGVPRVQSEVFMAAGKTYDVMINVPATGGTALPIFDRQLSLSGNATARDAGMLAYIGINGAGLPGAAAALTGSAVANPDTYISVIAGRTLTVSDLAKGVIANDVNIYGVQVVAGTVTGGTLTLNTNGTFTFAATAPSGSFQYCGNGATSGPACATVTLGAAPMEAGSGITVQDTSYTSNVATSLSIKSPGILSVDKDGKGYPLTVALSTVTPASGLTVSVDQNGGFNASVTAAGTYTFTYQAQNSQGTLSASGGSGGAGNAGIATVTLTFPTGSGLAVTVLDGADKKTQIADYRWIIEEDRTFYIDPKCTTNPPPTGCPTSTAGIVPTFGTNFHTSYMPLVATGCTGALSCEGGQTVLGVKSVCDVGNGVCRPDTSGNGQTPVDPKNVVLDPKKRYYISVLPGDAANPFGAAYGGAPDCSPAGSAAGHCGHGMGGAPISFNFNNGLPVQVLTQPTPFPPAKLAVFVFEDDFPLNGEHDGSGGIDVLSPNEAGLGSFQITLFDDAGGPGDATGQPTYDMFNMPLSNSLAGTPDPANNNIDACPISPVQSVGFDGTASPLGITGMIVTCPKYEADGVTLSPLAGQAVIANLYPGRYGVVATPAADRIARGEEWLQTNTLDGQKAHDSFLRIGEPSFFQEFGPAGYHVTIGFANPKIINDRLNGPDGRSGVCGGTDPNITGSNCTNSITGTVTTERMSRTPDERLYSSGSNASFAFTQCYVSFGDPDGEDFAFTKCNADGTFTLSGLPDGEWRITVFDQWNDMLVDGLSTPVKLSRGLTVSMGDIAMNQWQANIYTRTFFDQNGDGVSNVDGSGNPTEPGLALVATNIRFRDGSFSNFNNTDLNGFAGFNEVFPLFSWYVVETDTTRYKSTGTHVVYDAGGPADGTSCGSSANPPTAPCGNSNIAGNMANTAEQVSLPSKLRVPGAVYCDIADCPGLSIATGPVVGGSSGPGGSTGRIDPAWVESEGWQGFSGQNSFIEFGKKAFAAGENGGIHGHVVYASTRPFDDPQLLLQLSWEPQVPNVTINLYQEGTAPDGSKSLTLVDTTLTSSFDAWAQGFRSDGNPNMSCPGQGRDTGPAADLFFFSLYNQPSWLDAYNNGGTPAHTIPNNSQFKCYDGMHNWNQVQPAPYDGAYRFPSVTGIDPATGKPAGTNCTKCITNPDTTDPYRNGLPMLPAGKYVVEVVVPPGYELVKEEDKNILIGDNYIAPVTQQFAGLGNIFILPDQAAVGSTYNPNNPQNPTQDLGSTVFPRHEGDTGSVEAFWPCVGASRIVPDYISLFPQSFEVSPFAGATRNLCDRKEVTLTEQASALAKFYLFTSTHAAAHFSGVITDDYTSEFDPFSPQFGEKFSPADLPVSIKDWTGNEIARTYADHWGSYNGLTYSTWEVNPPNPTGYAPQMMVTCMNDPGNGPTPDPLFNPSYSQFCYEIPFMPGQTQYMDTPVVPTSGFAGAGYNNPDCAYPDATPAIKEVDGDGFGPWVSAAGKTIRITALGDQMVNNNAYSGPSATTFPYNAKTIPRHYDFGTTAGNVALLGSDGVSRPLTGVSWSPTTITGTVPSGLPNCGIQQQAQYGGPNPLASPAVPSEKCGQLVITAANGKQSIDTVTVTIGGKTPKHVLASGTIQSAIDAAMPGDLIIVDPTCIATTAGPCATTGAANHNEILIMWKPVRLQGVGAASSILNANTHPAGKLDPWRRQIVCLFGLAINGMPTSGTNPYDPSSAASCPGTGWNGFSAGENNPQIDRLPLEAVVGWTASLNGNLAELLQEPTLMGALEGAAITVLSKGVDFHGQDPFQTNNAVPGVFPDGTTLLTANTCGPNTSTARNPFPSSFWCNPSSIDGLGITNSSQGGGGIFVHAWGHNLQIANDRIYNNTGTLSGGISVGQGEFAPSYIQGSILNAAPGSCETSPTAGVQLPYCEDMHVDLHNNYISLNSATGDELFSATPAGAGGVSFCTGADYYKFHYNWVCGNLSTGDGGGVGHLGFIKNGLIEHNTVVFNQSLNPTIIANGGGILVMGTPDVDPPCGLTTDADCLPPLGSVAPSDGMGPGLVINANLIMGNAAESGSGGGLRFQGVNGTEVVAFPTRPAQWYHATVTNNIIANNVAGWDGGGVSLLDALNLDFINNTVVSNSTTASAGILFNTLQAPLASSGGNNCIQGSTTTSCPQVAGLVSIQNSANFVANLTTPVTCPAGHYAPGTAAVNGTCKGFSYPLLANNVFWQNSAYYIGVGGLGSGGLTQQNVVSLYNAFTTTPAPSQPQTGATTANGNGVIITGGTGACVPRSYWDIGVRGDTGPANHASTNPTLAPTYSVLTDAIDYPGTTSNPSHNLGSNPTVVSQYCDGSRTPPEFGSAGWAVPPGIADATVPNPVFNLTPVATVDEGNNWINLRWGPLSMVNPVNNTVLGSYAQAAGSPATDAIPPTSAGGLVASRTDFFGRTRPQGPAFDIGAVEFVAAPAAIASVTGGPLAFGNVPVGTTSASRQLVLHNTGNATLTGITLAFSSPRYSRPAGAAGGTCGLTLNPGTCTINVVFSPTVVGTVNATLTITASVPVTGSPVTLSGTGFTPVVSATLTPTNWSPFATRGVGGGLIPCIFGGGPCQVFTLRNTGNVNLTGIAQGALGGLSPADYAIIRMLSTCGPAGGGQILGQTTLAPGATCAVTVQFRPLTTDALNSIRNATVSVAVPGVPLATTTSTLTGTAQ